MSALTQAFGLVYKLNRAVTVHDLTDNLGCSKRTARRRIAELRRIGLLSERGRAVEPPQMGKAFIKVTTDAVRRHGALGAYCYARATDTESPLSRSLRKIDGMRVLRLSDVAHETGADARTIRGELTSLATGVRVRWVQGDRTMVRKKIRDWPSLYVLAKGAGRMHVTRAKPPATSDVLPPERPPDRAKQRQDADQAQAIIDRLAS